MQEDNQQDLSAGPQNGTMEKPKDEAVTSGDTNTGTTTTVSEGSNTGSADTVAAANNTGETEETKK